MPKIAAPTIAEHIAHQREHVFRAAISLFTERGFSHVGMGDIAAEVGLARNSLYRYFPSKASILVEWSRTELADQTARSEALLGATGPPLERLQRWADEQLDYALRPEHVLLADLPAVLPELDEQTRAELASSHDGLVAPLRDTLGEAGVSHDGVDAAADLIGGLVLAAAEREARRGHDDEMRARMAVAIRAIVGA